MKHRFGGIWTREKLQVLDAYLRFYTTALKNQVFTLRYIDAFAGTGSHVPANDAEQPMLVPFEDFKGSVLTALDVEPGFDRYHFNDLNKKHVKELRRIQQEYLHKTIDISEQDANSFVAGLCSQLKPNDRAVLFLDPYSTQLDWSTLQQVKQSEKVDLWLLFPISVILRMTPRDGDKLRPEWRDTLNRLLGTDEWEQSLYKEEEGPPMDDLFGEDSSLRTRRLNTRELEHWVTLRLRRLFPFVADPLPLSNQGRPLFLFYFAVSNPDRKAWGLAQRAANHIINTFGR